MEINFFNNINALKKNISEEKLINNLINIKNRLEHEIISHDKYIDELKTLVKEIDNKLEKECNHNWRIDYSNCGEHTQFICTICNSCK
jgi:replicative DNA helicase